MSNTAIETTTSEGDKAMMTNQEIAAIMDATLSELMDAIETLQQTGSNADRARVLAMRWRLTLVEQGMGQLALAAAEDKIQRVA